MNQGWQWTGNPANPTDFARGPQVYDQHLYFKWGGVAPEHTEDSYMRTLCSKSLISFNVY